MTDMKLFLSIAYLGANLLCVMAYAPQVWKVVRFAKAREDVILIMWWTWSLGGITEWLYASSFSESLVWQMVAFGHAIMCSLVSILASYERCKRMWIKSTQEKSSPVTVSSSRL